MLHCIARMLDPLLRLLWPPPGRHRQPCAHPLPVPPSPAPAPTAAPVPEPWFWGENSPLVRPYLLAHERRQAEARRQRGRRRALWLAVHGIDIGPRLIHGREVTS
ncbi:MULTISPECIES: hypothetical protein [Streptomyces]|uniref:Uncharacterized protein n=1 Tax=Streptomyces fradiae ATCC 10745 = DSM 40063 TaxID=1319510 RepID=A0A1Y2NP66_STRFR|nr:MULTISPECIES: hypothetical protein [Streptomyces]KAF0650269.1 hypothetical protein K701_08930 [Streptomyces fradiae ATCC 10745 = DSM 40063]OSY49266.1 hypothetical protein BG846_05168 [Streptomyces fradiae ATCC 10745 = DSM 40063]QEV12332.1 hypothetical protein CP974_10170 [Streptomyces fradiae ATCC 10745 = DSM 40063]